MTIPSHYMTWDLNAIVKALDTMGTVSILNQF